MSEPTFSNKKPGAANYWTSEYETPESKPYSLDANTSLNNSQYDSEKMKQDAPTNTAKDKDQSSAMKEGFSKGAQGGLGTGLTSAGMYSMMSGNVYGGAAMAAGGMIISGVEQKQKNKQAEEANRIKAEETQRANQISAINNLMSMSRGMGV